MIAAEAVAPGQASEPWAPRADESAWIAEAYEAHARELAAYVARSFGGRVIPEDVVHEAFARLVRDVAAGRAPLLVRPWLYRVAHNLAVDELRRPIRFEPETAAERAPAAWITVGRGGVRGLVAEPGRPAGAWLALAGRPHQHPDGRGRVLRPRDRRRGRTLRARHPGAPVPHAPGAAGVARERRPRPRPRRGAAAGGLTGTHGRETSWGERTSPVSRAAGCGIGPDRLGRRPGSDGNGH